MTLIERVEEALKFDEWHEYTDCRALNKDDKALALEEVLENMICYILKNSGYRVGCYFKSYRGHLDNMCLRGHVTREKKEKAIVAIEQINNPDLDLYAKIKIIMNFTGHEEEHVTDQVVQAWNPTRPDKYDPELVGMTRKLYNFHLLTQT